MKSFREIITGKKKEENRKLVTVRRLLEEFKTEQKYEEEIRKEFGDLSEEEIKYIEEKIEKNKKHSWVFLCLACFIAMFILLSDAILFVIALPIIALYLMYVSYKCGKLSEGFE